MIKTIIMCLLIQCILPEVVQAAVHGYINSSNTRASFAISRDGDDKRIYDKMQDKFDLLKRKTIFHSQDSFRLMCSMINCSSFVIEHEYADISFENDSVYYQLENEAAHEITKQFKLAPGEEWNYVSTDEKLTIIVAKDLFVFQYGQR
ncbi:MAG: hypothetical protein ISR65_13960 [Bacteriovoracaceae bacterium]|nr:hypothetical protein [Bacteriovoracaceae bacterium]